MREHPIYVALEQGECGQAQEDLDRWWDDMYSPRNVLLYQSAIHVCRGEMDSSRRFFDQATDVYGWQGLDHDVDGFMYDCQVYKSVRGYVERRDRDSFTCPSGAAPRWPSGPDDDPRTPEDESTMTVTTFDGGDQTTTSTNN